MTYYAVVGKFPKQKGLGLARDERKQDARAAGFKEDEPSVVIERGPWVAAKDGKSIQSEDSTHDVALYVTGDFESDAQRIAYTREIARRPRVRHERRAEHGRIVQGGSD